LGFSVFKFAPRKKCIKDKTRALKKYPNFHQYLEEIDYSEVTPNIYKVTFNKLVRLKESSKLDVYPSYLLIDTSTSSILVEGDEVTDKKSKTEKFDRIYTDSKGNEYQTTFNKHGAVMKSKAHTLYLGKNCDASLLGEKGEWEWANAGFEVRFDSNKIIFGGEILIENDGRCGFDFYNQEESLQKPKIKTSTPKSKKISKKEICKKAEARFIEKYEVFEDAQLNPKETLATTFYKQKIARDEAFIFVKACKNVSRNVLWKGANLKTLKLSMARY